MIHIETDTHTHTATAAAAHVLMTVKSHFFQHIFEATEIITMQKKIIKIHHSLHREREMPAQKEIDLIT